MTSSGADLDSLLGIAECPVVLRSYPAQRDHLATALRLGLGPGPKSGV
jgi:hypothetical protein